MTLHVLSKNIYVRNDEGGDGYVIGSFLTSTTHTRGSLFRAIMMRMSRVKQICTDMTIKKGVTSP